MIQYELPWSGEPFAGDGFLAIDTETAVYSPEGREYDLAREIPPMVLATVSDGVRTVVLRPEEMTDFLGRHNGRLWVGHNIAFDYWVIHNAIPAGTMHPTFWRTVWETWANLGWMDDTMLLDFLVRLSDLDAPMQGSLRNLGQVAQMVGLEADKESPYRLTFHKIIGQDWSRVDPGFFQYACQDTYVTWHVYNYLLQRAKQQCEMWQVPADRIEAHGYLTSKLQTRASIALAEIGRNGMVLDTSRIADVTGSLGAEVSALVDQLETLDPPVFQHYVRTGEWKRNRGTGVPKMNHTNLRHHLEKLAVDTGIPREILPRTPKADLIGTRLDPWRDLAGDTWLVKTWADMADRAKVLQFLASLNGRTSVHPRYNPLVRTGRTSCTKPNIQQMPREPWFRSLFVARPGHSLVICDYSAIEIVTLAAVLHDRYGEDSVLVRVLREGRKPHDYTAALILGIPYEEMVAGVKAEKLENRPGFYSSARQAAKAVNFGVPGGLGARRLSEYARVNYGVSMSIEEARKLRKRLVTEIYPELDQYLRSTDLASFAEALGRTEAEVRKAFGCGGRQLEREIYLLEVVVGGDRFNRNRMKLTQSMRYSVWDFLGRLNCNPKLAPLIDAWAAGDDLHDALFPLSAVTLTGRVRSRLAYGESRNTPFQGLAADGAKVALWRLLQAGYRVVAFIHDEIVVETEDHGCLDVLQDVETIMKESMASVLYCDIPVEVEGKVSKSWTK